MSLLFVSGFLIGYLSYLESYRDGRYYDTCTCYHIKCELTLRMYLPYVLTILLTES